MLVYGKPSVFRRGGAPVTDSGCLTQAGHGNNEQQWIVGKRENRGFVKKKSRYTVRGIKHAPANECDEGFIEKGVGRGFE